MPISISPEYSFTFYTSILYHTGIKEVLSVLAAFAVGGSSHFSVLSAAISSTSTVELVSKRFLAVRLYVSV